MYQNIFLFFFCLKLKRKINIVINNSACSEVEMLMTRLQVPQHYESVAIWQVRNRTSSKIKSNKDNYWIKTEALPFAFLCFFSKWSSFLCRIQFYSYDLNSTLCRKAIFCFPLKKYSWHYPNRIKTACTTFMTSLAIFMTFDREVARSSVRAW